MSLCHINDFRINPFSKWSEMYIKHVGRPSVRRTELARRIQGKGNPQCPYGGKSSLSCFGAEEPPGCLQLK